MAKVIETNLSVQVDNTILDHQSRIIKVKSWDEYVNEIKNGETVVRNSYLGNLHGCTLPKQSKVENLIYDDIHLSCDVYNWSGVRSKKLAYLII